MVRRFLLVAGLLAVGCGDDGEAGEKTAPVCEAGKVAECPCAGSPEMGVQTCAGDGSKWGACEMCPSQDTPQALCVGPLVDDDLVCKSVERPQRWASCAQTLVESGKCISISFGYFCCEN